MYYEKTMFLERPWLRKAKSVLQKRLSTISLFIIGAAAFIIWFFMDFKSLAPVFVSHFSISLWMLSIEKSSSFARGCILGIIGLVYCSMVKSFVVEDVLFDELKGSNLKFAIEVFTQWILLFNSVLVGFLITREISDNNSNCNSKLDSNLVAVNISIDRDVAEDLICSSEKENLSVDIILNRIVKEHYKSKA
ncbi:hypothetical protein [Vibrio parahaemolyticus]|uniref:hypothetical protein n=1 Tax=Vibrio parahaemolyticus TaxID=670 RepID=UPI00111D2E14|nr:hypothetical protein [Vibrio parahaemolyticus]TNY95365.1 hypothetical protein CGK57_23505 [Vibrio parahaemolyticus]